MDSIDILELFYDFKRNDSVLWIEGNDIQLLVSEDFKSEELRNKIVTYKKEIINSLLYNGIFSKDDFIRRIIFKSFSFELPLSFAQERLWFIENYEEGTNAYHIPRVYTLDPDTDMEGVKYALQQIICRHEVLRTTYTETDDQQGDLQIVNSENLPLDVYHLTDKDDYKSLIKDDINRPFNLRKEYPIRVNFYSIKSTNESVEDKTLLLINIHHIASDGWSNDIFKKEWSAYYEAYIRKELDFNLPELQIQYKDYAIWQRSYLKGEALTKQLNYWKEKLAGFQTLKFPTDYRRPQNIDYKGASLSFKFNKEVSKKLRSLTQLYGVTFHSVMLSSVNILLSKYTGQDDIIVGSLNAGRHHRQTEQLIGFFVNTQVNRTQLNPSQSFLELIHEVHQGQIEAQLYQDLPFQKLVDALGLESDTSRHPVFQVMFDVQSFGHQNNAVNKQKSFFLPYQEEGDYEIAQFDLSITIDESREEIEGWIRYATSLFRRDTIAKLIEHYIHLLDKLTEYPTTSYSNIDLFSPEEYQTVIYNWNKTNKEYPVDKTISELFEEQVNKTPDKIALVYEEETLTYLELNERSNQLAHYIRDRYKERTSKVLSPGTMITLYLEKSIEMIVSILAVLKAGGTYVPMDPGYPQDRIDYVLEDTGAEIILSNIKSTENNQRKLPKEKIIYISNTEKLYTKPKKENIFPRPNAVTDPAYVIYTSGTTGKPKGIVVGHRAFSQFIYNFNDYLSGHINSTERNMLSLTNYVFDIFGLEYALPLIAGGKMVLASVDTIKEEYFTDKPIIQQTPGTLLHLATHFSDKLSQLTCLVGGEALQSTVAELLLKTFNKVINVYGPAETVIWSTAYELKDMGKPYIGKALFNEKTYILDSNQVPVPIGVVGELYIGGAGLSEGYLNRPLLTEERFISNPFATEEDKSKGYTRLYKTGDLVRWLPDGNIEYIGRNDDQVKIRGYRIELGEIENALIQIKGIKQACVVVKDNKTETSTNKYLVGYYILSKTDSSFNEILLREKLEQVLPAYMIPAVLVPMDSFPLTINGKLDKCALPDPVFKSVEEYVAPGTEQEKVCCKIWQEILGLERVGTRDDFFKIGGNSILAIQTSHRMAKLLRHEVEVADVFKYKNISQILTQSMGNRKIIIPKTDAMASVLSFAQERLWFIEQYEEGSNAYHIPGVYKVDEAVDINGVKYAIQQIVSRHEVLRSTIEQGEDQNGIQIVHTDPIHIEELTLHTTDDHKSIIKSEINRPFDLSKEYPIRIKLYFIQAPDSIHEHARPVILLLINMHHIASDGWSMGVFQKEFLAYYEAYSKNDVTFNLPGLAIQYKDYALWQRNYLRGEVMEKQLSYWKEKLLGYQTLEMPIDCIRPHTVDYRGAHKEFILSKELSGKLRGMAKGAGVTLHSVMLSGIAILLSKYSGQDDIVIGSDIASRHHHYTAELIGFFVNMQVSRTQLHKTQNYRDLIFQVHQEQMESQQHQDLPFERLVNELGIERDESRHPVFQVTFGVHSFGGINKITERQKQYFKPYRIENAYEIEKFDLSIGIDDSKEELIGHVGYATSLFKRETIERFIDHYSYLLDELTKSPDKPYSQIALLNTAACQTQLNVWNKTEKEFPETKTIYELFEDQVKRTPNNIALVYEGVELSYKELNQRSNQLARHLKEQYELRTNKKFTADTLIALCMERSLEMVVGILAVFKAGGAYVPVDPGYPQERIDYMLADTNTELILTHRKLRKETEPQLPKEKVIYIELSEELYKKQAKTNLSKLSKPRDLSYVIYTSGSTGKPKGAMIEHVGMVNHLYAKINLLNITEKSVVVQNASASFDISVWQFFAALLCGGKVLIYNEDLVLNPNNLINSLKQDEATILEVVPSYLSAMLDVLKTDYINLESLEFTLVTGEELKSELVNRWFDIFPKKKLINAYGPTEASDDITHHVIEDYKTSKLIPIGKPIQNLKIYIVNEFMQLCPVGIKGEICVSGIGVGRGYLNNPLKTKEVFMEDPFATEKNVRLYKTGDIGRWQADGSILYICRKDEQVKIRGHRIELGEIEHVLSGINGIKHACVLVKERKTETTNTKYLVGYYVTEDENEQLNKKSILDKLNQVLPEYMVPAILVAIDKFPLTSNGKLDKKALPDPEFTTTTDDYATPGNETELILYRIWEGVLGVSGIGINDDFFRIGGDSILSIQVSSRIRQAGFNCQVKEIFEHKTIARLAKHLDKKSLVQKIQAEQGILTGNVGLLPIQQWFLERVDSGELAKANHWNQSFILRVPQLDPNRLKAIIKELVLYHDILRIEYMKETDFQEKNNLVNNHWKQSYQANIKIPELKILDISQYNESSIHQELTSWQSAFDIENGPLFQPGYLFGYKDGSARVYFALHHLIVDAVSWRILCDDLKTLYEGKRLPPKGSSYRQWIQCVENYAQAHLSEVSYWESQLSGIPMYFIKNVQQGMSSVSFVLDKELTRYLLQEAHKAYHTEINDLLLTGLAYALKEINQSDTQGIMLEGHGREDIDETIDHSRTLGWFTTMFPLKLELQKGIGASIKHIKEHLRSIPHKGIGFGPIAAGKIKGNPEKNLAPVSFNYLGQFDAQEDAYWQIVSETSGESVDPENSNHYLIDINGIVSNGYLKFGIMTRLGEAVSKQLSDCFKTALMGIIQHCKEKLQKRESSFTPSDFNSVRIDQTFINQLEKEAKANKNEIEHIYLANSLQQGFVYHALSQKDDDAYRVQVLYDYHEKINISNYLKAWEYCIVQYPILRTAFNWEKDLLQIVYKYGKLEYELHDISHINLQKERDAVIINIQEEDRKKKFNLGQASLFRIHIIKQSADYYTVLENKHHSITDGWSAQVLLASLNRYYQVLNSDKLISLKEDKAYLLTQEYINKHKEEAQVYWKTRLSKVDSFNDISALLCKPINLRTYKHIEQQEKENLIIEGEFYNTIKTFSQKEGITLNVIVQFIWHKLLQVYSNSPKTIAGTTISGRDLPIDGIEESVGLYINTLPLLIDWEKKNTIKEQLYEIQERITEMNTYSFAELAKLQRNGERLFHSFLGYENYPTRKKNEEVSKISFRNAVEKGDYPLIVVAYEYNYGLKIELVYDSNYLTKDKAKGHLSILRSILQQIVKEPNAFHSHITLINPEEYQKIIFDWNATGKDYPLDKTVIDLFEEQVSKTPDNIAVSFEEKKLTYRDVDEQSDKLAAYLIEHHKIQKGDLIGIMLDKSEKMIISIFGILKSGAAFVCIDPEYPLDRKQYILDDASLKVLITQTDYILDLVSYTIELFAIDTQLNLIEDRVIPFKRNIKSVDLAYVIYTSGTTGKPKGVMLGHKGLSNLVFMQKSRLGINPGTKIMQFASLVFDASVWEIFSSLVFGGELSIISSNTKQSPDLLNEYLELNQINIATLPPALLSIMPYKPHPFLKTLIVAGEECPSDVMVKWSHSRRLINAYGPTENTVCATMHEYNHGDLNTNIGKPIDNVRIYVLDPMHNPVPIGVIGELYIGGVGLALGYLNQEELTQERFIHNPFSTEQDKNLACNRLYKTGDLVRWLENGDLEYMGRNDDQVKIRGHRIELTEIEHSLTQIKGVKQACLLVKEREVEDGNNKFLTGYYVPDKDSVLARANYIRKVYKNKISENKLSYELLDKHVSAFTFGKTELEFLHKEIFKSDTYLSNISIKDGDCILDIGANIGMASLFFSQQANDLKIYSFEPIDKLYDVLNMNLFIHSQEATFKTFNCGIGAENESNVPFSFFRNNTAMSSQYPDKKEDRQVLSTYLNNTGNETDNEQLVNFIIDSQEQVLCHIRTLSEIIREENIEKIDLLKIDVEKAELDVIKGIDDDDWHKIKQIVIEVHNSNGRLEIIQSILLKKGYEIEVQEETDLQNSGLFIIYAIKRSINFDSEKNSNDLIFHNNLIHDISAEYIKYEGEYPLISSHDLCSHLRMTLPEYMVPDILVEIESFFLTINGKLDKNALPLPDFTSKEEYVPPTLEQEITCCAIWQEVLGLERVGITDNFFKIGGNSILAIQVSNRMRTVLKSNLNVGDMFKYTTIKALLENITVAEVEGIEWVI